ncbi:hypothetical protein [Pseudomonas sp. WAC2]|nr:hypothetical protein [Pseudomonas sp. WAC2]MDN3236827.1 hypothetical protein [Pseudomonas sp. WAC2]
MSVRRSKVVRQVGLEVRAAVWAALAGLADLHPARAADQAVAEFIPSQEE